MRTLEDVDKDYRRLALLMGDTILKCSMEAQKLLDESKEIKLNQKDKEEIVDVQKN